MYYDKPVLDWFNIANLILISTNAYPDKPGSNQLAYVNLHKLR